MTIIYHNYKEKSFKGGINVKKKFLIIVSIAILLIGQVISPMRSEILFGGPDDAIDIHSVTPVIFEV